MEIRLCLRKAQRSNKRTKMLDAEKQHGWGPNEGSKKREGLQADTIG